MQHTLVQDVVPILQVLVLTKVPADEWKGRNNDDLLRGDVSLSCRLEVGLQVTKVNLGKLYPGGVPSIQSHQLPCPNSSL